MRLFRDTDWAMLASAVMISLFGIVTMYGFGTNNAFAPRQALWLLLGLVAFFGASVIDWRFLRRTPVVVAVYGVSVALLAFLFLAGSVFNGARSWLNVGAFAIEPVDPAKLALIIVLAKYFSRRHIEIARFRHIAVSGFYMFVVFALLFLQPDFGSAIIVVGLWVGIVLLAGIPLRHVLALATLGVVAISFLWFFGFADYQKARIINFIHPLADIHGTGYNAFQSTIAVGSGGIFGKGIGYGTQSRLKFLPEYQTDFIFAAFAEEWGLGGALILFALFGILLWRLAANAKSGAANFETLFAFGVAVLIIVHSTIHIGMNIGLLPVTGTTLPFMSYGGSHLLIGYLMLGIVNAMRRYSRTVHEAERYEVVGVG
jgi:rod shape determining protein RodA